MSDTLADRQMAFLKANVAVGPNETLADLRRKYYDVLSTVDNKYSVTDFELAYLKGVLLPLGPSAANDSISDYRRAQYYGVLSLPNEETMSNNDLQLRSLVLGNATP